MPPTITREYWVNWLATELTFTELYESPGPSPKHEVAAKVERLAKGIGKEEVEALISQAPNFNRTLSCFAAEDRNHLLSELASAVTKLAQGLTKYYPVPAADPDWTE